MACDCIAIVDAKLAHYNTRLELPLVFGGRHVTPMIRTQVLTPKRERLENLAEDKANVMADMKEVFAEAKGEGFDVKIIRKVLRLRAQDSAKRQEEEALIDLYISAIGGL